MSEQQKDGHGQWSWSDEHDGRIEVLYRSFKAARERIEKISHKLRCYNNADIPSINELRYVTYHILKAINEKDALKRDEELRRAIRHSERASYDIIEVGINDQIRYFVDFEEKYKNINISDVVGDWREKWLDINQINDFLAEINRSDQPGEEYYKIAEEKYREICEINDQLDLVREELDALVKDFWYDRAKVIIGLFVAIIMILILVARLIRKYSILL